MVLERFKRSLLERDMPLRSIILFGSRARGDAEPDSDYDSFFSFPTGTVRCRRF